MMGERCGGQDRLFYEFDLEEMVPADHLLRRIDAVLDLDWLRHELKPYYSHTGRPSICPELMIRMLLVGYCHSIRSERRLCEEVRVNLAYRWFCRLGLEDRVPDHSTFSVNRHGRFRDSDLFRSVFETVVRRCMEAGLVGGEGFAVDASVIEADASRYQRVEGSEINWTDERRSTRAVREYLTALEGDNPPINPKQKPKAVSPVDPSAAWTTRGRNKVMFGYSLNYLIDMEHAVIVDVEATPTRISNGGSHRTFGRRFGKNPGGAHCRTWWRCGGPGICGNVFVGRAYRRPRQGMPYCRFGVRDGKRFRCRQRGDVCWVGPDRRSA